jgi:hypothetical protein
MERRAFARYGAGVMVAIVASLINPCLGSAYIIDLQEIGQGTYGSVDEFLPLWSYAKLYQQPLLFYVPLLILAGSAAALVRRWYQAHPAQVINLVGFSIATLVGFRYMMVGVLMALAIGVPHASARVERHAARYFTPLLLAVLAVAMSIGTLSLQRSALRVGPIEAAHVPAGAVEFIRAHKPPAPLFSPYEYGGYLEWTLGGEYKLFYDQRSLDPAVYADYVKARDGRYADLFARYGIKTVVFYLRTPVLNSVPPLVPALLNDPRWDVVFADAQALVLTRRGEHAYAVYDKARILDYLKQSD